jgi:hypothetical protein
VDALLYKTQSEIENLPNQNILPRLSEDWYFQQSMFVIFLVGVFTKFVACLGLILMMECLRFEYISHCCCKLFAPAGTIKSPEGFPDQEIASVVHVAHYNTYLTIFVGIQTKEPRETLPGKSYSVMLLLTSVEMTFRLVTGLVVV